MTKSHEPEYPQLQLSNQLCFPFYAASMLITRHYQPLLDELGITYPQYLVLMVLWEKDNLTVGQISNELLLNTNTLTPLLKRMEKGGLICRTRSSKDERQVLITMTEAGWQLRSKAALIPQKIMEKVNYPLSDAITLMKGINQFLLALKESK
jgi:DNA-binding MarR family transcriptional regulator